MPCGMRGGGTAVPLPFISHGRDVAGRRAPKSPALPLTFHPTLPGGGFQPGPPLSAGYASGYFPRSSRYLVFQTVSVYYHTPGKVSREGWIFAPGLPGGNYGTMFPVRAWQGGDALVPRLRPGMEGRWGWEHGQTGEKRAEKRAGNRPGPGVSGRFRFFSGTCQEGGSLVQWNELIDSIRQNSTQAEAIPRRGGGKSA